MHIQFCGIGLLASTRHRVRVRAVTVWDFFLTVVKSNKYRSLAVNRMTQTSNDF